MPALLRLYFGLLLLAPALVHAATLRESGQRVIHYSGVSAWRHDNTRNEETTDRKNANCDTREVL